MATAVSCPVSRSSSKFPDDPSSCQDKKLNLLSAASGINKLSNRHENETSKSWQSLVKYGENLEYDYFAITDRKTWKKYVHIEFSVKDTKVGLFYHAEENNPKKRFEFNPLETQPDGKTPEIEFEWSENKSTLSAELKSSILLSYISHLNGGNERVMVIDKSTPLFCFQTLHEQLVEGGTQITFDPHKTKLRFKPKTGKKCY